MPARDVVQPILIVCEGPSDCGLIAALTKEHSISSIQSICPNKQLETGDGFTSIPKLLKLLNDGGQLAKLRGLALVVDANGDPAKRVAEAVKMLASVNFTVTQAFEREERIPTAGVYMFPGPGKAGCLENLLLKVIRAADEELINSVDSFANAVQKPLKWSPNKQAKMRVHSLIAACCEEDPASSLSWVWRKNWKSDTAQ